MKEIIIKILLGVAFLQAAEWLLSPRFSTVEVLGLFCIMVAAAI